MFRFAVFPCSIFALLLTAAAGSGATLPVTRATLSNGLQVIVVHDPLAPVVTTVMNYRIGGDDEPIDGLAHATEHMMFRGSKTVTESQLSDISAITGGNNDADTQNEITQYFFTMPSQYLDIALRLESSRVRDANLDQKDWKIERGAILNEVTQDNSLATERGFRRITRGLLGGTPYANDVLGTIHGFKDQINAPQLRQFYRAWYHPNNAVLIITGNVDGPSTIERVKRYFGAIPAAPLPARKTVALRPVKPAVYHEDSEQPYGLIIRGYRFPGFDDKDYAASQILESVLSNQRSELFQLVIDGKSLFTQFQSQDFPRASIGIAVNVVPVTKNATTADDEMRAVFAAYRRQGIPADLVEVAKKRAIADAEYKGNSIEGLAFAWSQAVAVQGLRDPDDFLSALRRVSVDDVNRVMRKYVVDSNAVAAYMVPKNLGKINPNAPQEKAAESNKLNLTHHDPLPSWAISLLTHLRVPAQTIFPTDTHLANGLRLIVVPETITHTVIVHGQIQSNAAIQAPAGKDGVADMTAQLMPYGTTTYSRVAFRAELDKIAAEANPGTDFSLQTPSGAFDRGLQLLADEELHPAFPADSFATVKQQTVDAYKGQDTAPDHLVEVALANALYPLGDPARRFATAKSAQAVGLDDVKAYFGSVYRPDMTTVVVIGDVTPSAARATVEKYFGDWKAAGPKPVVDPSPVPDSKASDVSVPATGRVQSSVRLSETLKLTRLDPDWASLRVATAVLGSGGNSILFHDLRDTHGYVYGAGSQLAAEKTRSVFNVNFASDPQKVAPAQALALKDIVGMQQKALPLNDVVFGKAMLVSAVPIQQQSYDGVTNALLRYASLDLPLNQDRIDAARTLRVTPAIVREVMARWIRPADFARVIEGPLPK